MQLNFPHVLQSNSPAETEGLGASLAMAMQEDAALPRFVALYGDLGVGKTAFVRGFASVLSPESLVRSPTFTLVNEYRNKSTKKSLFHFDMYRIDSEEDLYSMGFDDYPDRGICIAEWCEKIPYALPLHYLRVTIVKNNAEQPNSREILIERI
ncbi:MAG: tRNA (adenosine(37)-N6)-threonylcarbamoyltransferase complex ATPase subunit type 1 TsaE [Ruminococcaceae bacterium]|nr:tRNA (adenosine(37)-N6)-threonylcarbamoyltransferase complex ATPase subunit type 1 TsaE [Oscillospiraceae bacterium]